MEMQIFRRTLTSLLLAFVACSAAGAQPTTAPATLPAVEPAAVAEAAARALLAGDADGFAAVVTPRVRKLAAPDKLRRLGASLPERYGPFEGFAEPAVAAERGVSVVTLTALFERQAVTFSANVDEAGEVAGFWIVGLAPRGAAVPWADYVLPDRFAETEVAVGAGDAARTATLSLPNGDGPFPAVLLIRADDVTDPTAAAEDGRMFRDLAGGLASRGVAVLRLESDADAESAFNSLRERPEVDAAEIFLFGHSLGGLLGPRIVQAEAARPRDESSPVPAGVILAATPARPVMDVLVGQVDFAARLDGRITPDEQERLDAVVAATVAVRGGEVSDDATFLGTPLALWKQIDAAWTTQELAAAKMFVPQLKVLILAGGRDEWATAADRAAWRTATAGDAGVSTRLYPSLDHRLVSRAGPASRGNVEHVAESLVTDVAAWITTGALPPQTAEPAESPATRPDPATRPEAGFGETSEQE